MKSGYKTPEAVEFIEIADELREKFSFNWTKIGEIAGVSAQMVSLIRKGSRSPGEPSLLLLRRHLKDLTEPESRPPDLKANEFYDRLENLRKVSPATHQAAMVVVDAMIRGVSSDVASAARATRDGAVAAAEREHQESRRKPPTGGPTSYKRGRARGASRSSSKPPASPTQPQE